MKMISNISPDAGDKIFENLAIDTVWLSTFDAAKFLGISQNALRILVCRGKVKFYKLGRRLKFSRTDLECMLKKGT